MPEIFKHLGYKIYFWSNEGEPLEPVHIHISKGIQQKDGTKLWLLKNGDTILVHNKGKVPDHEIRKIQKAIKKNKNLVISLWIAHFGSIHFHEDN